MSQSVIRLREYYLKMQCLQESNSDKLASEEADKRNEEAMTSLRLDSHDVFQEPRSAFCMALQWHKRLDAGQYNVRNQHVDLGSHLLGTCTNLKDNAVTVIFWTRNHAGTRKASFILAIFLDLSVETDILTLPLMSGAYQTAFSHLAQPIFQNHPSQTLNPNASQMPQKPFGQKLVQAMIGLS